MLSVAAVTVPLQAIARESESVSTNSRALSTACNADRSIAHTMAIRELSHACNLLASRIAALRRLVTRFDQDIAGMEVGSLAELGLRAQTLAILLLLDELYSALRSDTSTYQELFAGRLRTIEDVVSYLFDSLARINHIWLRHRPMPHGSAIARAAEGGEAIRVRLYRSAIRCAQRAVLALGADPDLAHFLRAGSARSDAPQIRDACDELIAVLKITLTHEPDPALLLAAATLEPEQLCDLTEDRGTRGWRAPRKP